MNNVLDRFALDIISLVIVLLETEQNNKKTISAQLHMYMCVRFVFLPSSLAVYSYRIRNKMISRTRQNIVHFPPSRDHKKR